MVPGLRWSVSIASQTSIPGRRGMEIVGRGSATRSVQSLLQLEPQHCAGLCEATAGVCLGSHRSRMAAELLWSSLQQESVAAQQQTAGDGSS